MSELHDRFVDWLASGAHDEPMRDVALHASGCAECLAAAAAMDDLLLVDLGAAPRPPAIAAAQPARPLAASRWGSTAATAAAAVVLVLGIGYLAGIVRPANLGSATAPPAGEVLAGVPEVTLSPSLDAPPDASVRESASPIGTASAKPSASAHTEPGPGSVQTPPPVSQLPPIMTPLPTTSGAPATPWPTPAATMAPTAAPTVTPTVPPTVAPTAPPTPTPSTATPTPDVTPTPTPTSVPTDTPSPTPS